MNGILAYLALPRVAKILDILACSDYCTPLWSKKKKIYLGLFEIFLFENWRFLGILLSINPANKVHTRKCFNYNFPILLPSTPKLKFYPQIFEISLFVNCSFFTTCSFSHAKHCRTWGFCIPMNFITKLGKGTWFDYNFVILQTIPLRSIPKLWNFTLNFLRYHRLKRSNFLRFFYHV